MADDVDADAGPRWQSVPAAAKAAQLKAMVGDALAAARAGRPLRDVAAELGGSHVPLVELEQGRANPTLERLARVAHAYGGHFEVEFVADDG